MNFQYSATLICFVFVSFSSDCLFGQSTGTASGTNLLKRTLERNAAAALESRERGDLEKAALSLEKCIVHSETLYGKNSPATAEFIESLAKLYEEMNRFDEAERLYRRFIRFVEVHTPKDSVDRVIVKITLANLLEKRGKDAEALPILVEILRFSETNFGEDSPETAISLARLASLHQRSSRFADAEPLFLRAMRIYEKHRLNEDDESLLARSNLGILYLEQHRHVEARPILEKSWELSKKSKSLDSGKKATIANNLAKLYHDIGRYDEAEHLYRQAIEQENQTEPGTRKSPTVASANLASLYADRGEFEAARELFENFFEKSREIYGEEHFQTAFALSMLGGFHARLQQYSEAEPLLDAALAIRQKSFGENHHLTAASWIDLGVLRKSQGRYAEAESCFRKAVKIHVAVHGGESPLLFRSLNELGQLLAIQNRFEEAEPIIKRALDICLSTMNENDDSTITALHNYGDILIQLRRYEPGIEYEEKAMIRARAKYGDDYPLVGFILLDLCAVLNDTGGAEHSIPRLGEAIRIFTKCFGENDSMTVEATRLLAAVHSHLGRFGEAEELYDKNIENIEQYPIEPLKAIYSYYGRAKTYRATNRPEAAVQDLKKAMDMVLRMRKHVSGSDEQRAKTFADYYFLFETMVDWQHELGDMNEVYEAMERSRAQSMMDVMNACDADLAGIPDETAERLATEFAAARQEMLSCEKKLAAIYRNTDLSTEEKGKEEKRLFDLLTESRRRFIEVDGEIRLASPAYRMMIDKERRSVPFEKIRNDLERERTLVLEYLAGPEQSFLLMYGKETPPKLLPLTLDAGKANLLEVDPGPISATKWNTILQNHRNTGLLQILTDHDRVNQIAPDELIVKKLALLWNILVPDAKIREKLTDGVSFTRLLVLPDASLAKLPFEALIVEPDVLNPQYLLDRGPAVHYAPSASMYYHLKHRDREDPLNSVLTVGGPDYDRPDSNETKESGLRNTLRFRDWKPLPAAVRESEWIEQSCLENHLSVLRFNRAEATERNVRVNTADRRVIHLACHGFTDNEHGNLFGGLALSVGDPDDPHDDGFLSLSELFNLDVKRCELAVLSACDTNIGPNQQGEGTWSLGRGFLVSGAKRVVTTDWQVADDASAHLVYRFIDQMNRGNADYAEALRSAKQAIRSDREHPEWRHPYYWAPFVLLGPN